MALAAGGGGSKEGRDGKGGDGKGKGGDSPGLMLLAELKPLLKLSRRRPVSCAVVLTKDRQGVALLDRKVKPRKLAATLKSKAKAAGMELDPSTIRFGRASVDGASDSARVVFRVHKDAPAAMGRAMLPLLRPVGFQRCEFVTDAALEDEPEDGEDGEGEDGDDADEAGEADGGGSTAGPAGAGATGAGQGAPGQAPAAVASSPVPAPAMLAAVASPRAPLSAVVPPDVARGIAAAVAADPSRRPVLAGLLAQVRAGVDGGDPGAAERGVAALRQALDGPAPPLAEDGRATRSRATGAGQPMPVPATGPRPMQADATLADLARAWKAQQGQADAAGPGGAGRQGGPKAPALPASKSATLAGRSSDADLAALDRGAARLPPDDGEGLVTPVLSGDRWAPPPDAPPAPRPAGQLPPGLVPEVQAPSPLPGRRTVTREGLRAGGRAAGRFLVTKPNPYLMVAGAVLLVAMELMPRADEDGGEATVMLRQQGEDGQPGWEVAKLYMDQTGVLRAEQGGRGAVLGQMDPSGKITLMPAGEAYLRERAAQTPPAPAAGGFPGGTYDAMGNWTGLGEPGPAPQPGASALPRQATAEVPTPPASGTPPQPAPPLVVPDAGFEYDPHDPDEAELVTTMQGRSGQDIQNAINELRARKRGASGSGAGTPNGPVVPGQPPTAQSPARPGAAQPTPRDGVIGGKPVGEPETDPSAEPDKQEGLRLQARSEEAMAAAGYRVERSPVVRSDERLTQKEAAALGPKGPDPLGRVGPGKNPDARLGGNLADMVAPKTPKLEGVRDALSAKIKLRQAYRLVLNLGRTSVMREQIEVLLRRKPIEGLQELFIIEKNGAIFRAFPGPEQITPAPQAR